MRGAVTIKWWNVRWAMGTRSGVVGGFGEGRKEGRNEWGGWGRRGPGPVKCGVCAFGHGNLGWGRRAPSRLPAVTVAAAALLLV